jgi:serine protease Do
VVGINTAIFSRTGGYQGIGFAIPSNLARRVMESLGKHGEFVRGYLGVGLQPITPELAEQFNLKDRNGVLISFVEPDGPAAKAGIQEGDVLLKVNGREVDSPGTTKSIVGVAEPGSVVELELLRDGKQQVIQATLAKAPNEVAKEPTAGGQSEGGVEILGGLWAADLTAQLRERMGLPQDARGVAVVRVDESKIQSSMPLEVGDLIVSVNRMRTGSLQQVQKLVKETQRDNVLLLVQRGGFTIFATVKK